MKKRNSSIKELNRIGLRSRVSVYKTELSEHTLNTLPIEINTFYEN